VHVAVVGGEDDDRALRQAVALSSQIDSLVGIADIFIVSDLGADAISAVGMGRMITMVLGVVVISATTGAFAMVAQHVGARQPLEASATAKQAITLTVLISVILSLAGLASARTLLAALSLAPAVVDLGVTYLRVYYVGLPLLALNFALSNCFYGAGDTRTPLYINVVVSVIKVTATYVLVRGVGPLPALGVSGAAVGSVLGRTCGVVLGFVLL
jgi:Na+-driven multidrug efflux pump